MSASEIGCYTKKPWQPLKTDQVGFYGSNVQPLDSVPFYPEPFPMPGFPFESAVIQPGELTDDYQRSARSTAIYPSEACVIYPALGLAGEAGEFAGKVRDYMYPEGLPRGWDPVTEFEKQVFWALDAAATAGAECEKLKKQLRDKNKELDPRFLPALQARIERLTPEQKAELSKEGGDAAWYLANVSADLGLKLSEVFKGNLDKLASRKERGTLSGSGDNR